MLTVAGRGNGFTSTSLFCCIYNGRYMHGCKLLHGVYPVGMTEKKTAVPAACDGEEKYVKETFFVEKI